MIINKDITTEQAILEAAEEEFLDKGFAAAKTTEIAKRVGVNQALVHYYFRTKGHLFERIFLQKVRLLATSFIGVVEKDIPFFDKLKAQIEIHFEFMRANPRLPLFIITELTRDPGRLEALKSEFAGIAGACLKCLKEDLEIEVAKGNVRPVEPLDLLLDVVSMNVFLFIGRPMIQAVTNVNAEEFEKVIEMRKKEHVRLILDSLRP